MSAVLGSIGWITCVVYSTIPAFWLLIHPHTEFWRGRRSPYRILLPIWILMWLVTALITMPWRNVTLYSVAWMWIPAIGLFCAGFWIYSKSAKDFSAELLGGIPEIVKGNREQQLVTTGMRSRVRHPIYLGHLCEMLAFSIGTGLAVCYVLTAAALVTGAIMIRLEDKELEQRFGEVFRLYRRSVPAILPKIF